MVRNLHKLYFKEYFGGDEEHIRGKNRELLNAVLPEKSIPPRPLSPEEGLKTFMMKVLYPGLVTGVGLPHQENIRGEFKLGMHFDWTYGMPIIYGSSVKGVLHSYFQDEYNEDNAQDVMKVIFGTKEAAGADVFFDAVIVSAPGNHPLADDAITPHRDVFSNPTPLPFIKFAPGCIIEFRFKLSDKGLSTDDKISIFKTILEKYGIGAKTNVGYGRLSPL